MSSLGSYLGAGIISGVGQGAQQGFNTAAYGLSWYAMEQARGDWEYRREVLQQNAENNRLTMEQTLAREQGNLNRAKDLAIAQKQIEAESARGREAAEKYSQGRKEIKELAALVPTDEGYFIYDPTNKSMTPLTDEHGGTLTKPGAGGKPTILQTDKGYYRLPPGSTQAVPITEGPSIPLTEGNAAGPPLTKSGASEKPTILQTDKGYYRYDPGTKQAVPLTEGNAAGPPLTKSGAGEKPMILETDKGYYILPPGSTKAVPLRDDKGNALQKPTPLSPKRSGQAPSALSPQDQAIVNYLNARIEHNITLMKSPGIAADPDKMGQLDLENRQLSRQIEQRLGIRQPTSPFVDPMNSPGPGTGPAEMGPAGPSGPIANPFAPTATPRTSSGLLNEPLPSGARVQGGVTILPQSR
ncbi:MAG: hypothetical protein KGI71_05495 [Patescibacteria group bacterium]|nr:hypothetical protein [Patescibacteria group bacterium]